MRSLLRHGPGALAALVLLGAVSPVLADEEPAAPVHTEGEGPFSVQSGSGGFIAAAPVPRPYWISFGTDLPCMETDPEKSTAPASAEDEVVLTGVRYEDDRNPAAAVHILLRTVTPRMVRNRPPDRRDILAPFIAARGYAGRRQTYGTYVPGRYTTEVAGFAVRDTCADVMQNASMLSDRKVPGEAVTTLVFAIKTDSDGARVQHYLIDYTVNGEARTLRVNWTMGARRPGTFER